MDDLYRKQILTKRIFITADKLGKDIDKTIKDKLDNEINGICVKEGYIKPNTSSILLRSEGVLSINNFKSVIYYTIKFEAMICNPSVGQILECYVSNVEKTNINCYIENEDESPLNIFLSKQYHIGNEEYGKLKEGDKIKIQVTGKKCEYLNREILVIANFLEKI
jgi:DNA-directed RNA polymerase subunit E'/Rpb7